MTPTELFANVSQHLDHIKTRLLHPEKGWTPGMPRAKPLSSPKYRLAARLELLVALSRYRLELMREILSDTEAITDAKVDSGPAMTALVQDIRQEIQETP